MFYINEEIKKAIETSFELQKKELTIQSLIGLDLDTLIKLFAKGYKLTPPEEVINAKKRISI